ncbi:elongation factor P maturation arginine rhamnosyltransferase EarP [soil metagenome]
MAAMSVRTWDIFCRVVDNLGDIGVCWRLAADLAARGDPVRLWTDDASALAWMAPLGAPGVSVREFEAAGADVAPGGVVVEAFGCDPPEGFIQRMAAMPVSPVWVNLEYLSAEDFVERSHALSSPQMSGPGAGLLKWFFYPGFTMATGGLIREPGLVARQKAFDRDAWLATLSTDRERGFIRRARERVVSLFCYEQPALPALIDALSNEPTLLLAAGGYAARQVTALLGPSLHRGQLRAVALPQLTQIDYDHLLWTSDLNFVRGEDSFVRAQWAGAPFVWQIYPQDDCAHRFKLEAFMRLHASTAGDDGLAGSVHRLWRRWNQGAAAVATDLPNPWPNESPIDVPEAAAWHRWSLRWREALLAQPDLVTSLIRFADEKQR